MARIASSNSLNVYGSVSISSALGRSGNTTQVTGMRQLYVKMPRERRPARRPRFPAPNVAVPYNANGPTLSCENRPIFIGRDDRIRTCDPLTPSQVRYQAAPHPEK